jgi:hypothetical protein
MLVLNRSLLNREYILRDVLKTLTSVISMCNLHGSTQVKVTLRLTVGQSVSLGVKPHLGLMTRYLLLFDSYGLVFVGRPL